MSQSIIPLRQKEDVVISYNKLAMDQLQKENYESTLNYLKQALMGIQGIKDDYIKNKLMAVTYNNLGIFFKRIANFPEALKYLYKSIELESQLPNEISTIAGAYLNICSIHSQLGNHPKAIRYGLRSVLMLKSKYKTQPKLASTLVAAYYNVANEYLYIGQHGDAEDCYRIGYKISSEELGPQHSLTNTFKVALGNYSRKMSPNYERFGRGNDRISLSPKTRVPIVSAKSRSISQDSSKLLNNSGLLSEKQKYRNIGYEVNIGKTVIFGGPSKKIEIKRPVLNKEFFDETKSVTTEKSYGSGTSAGRKIDIFRYKETQRIAATIIQSCWRGYKAREKYKELQLNLKLKQAELKARKAAEKYKKLQQQAAKVNKKYK
ncbi:hypothetical protein SteCoe_14093 [Stentor coeruleus]|uniref:Uncharacterized protein n=1 Tax=Stentor coeruleus TaxID=5963 RepID=A0A1R2C6Q1_9CILI|nr:hypothetical protein SteCoe_14093 [Stentor coeruleus]